MFGIIRARIPVFWKDNIRIPMFRRIGPEL